MATIYWQDEHPELWSRFYGATSHSSHSMHAELEPYERHIPVSEQSLQQWRKELPFHGDSQYGQILRRDIGLAEKCNTRGCELIISVRQQTIAA
jgi:hypothetical protein